MLLPSHPSANRLMKFGRIKLFVLSTFAMCLFWQTTFSQENLKPEHEKFFESKIRPALVKYCYECHSIDSGMTRGGLLVDTRDGLLQGGESGPSIDFESLNDSLLLSAVNYDAYQMPPDRQMPASVVAEFEKWFEMGAPDPRVREKIVVTTNIDVEAGKSHWAFQKPVADTSQSIDTIVSQGQKSTGTQPVEAADPAILLRRLRFDLTGLPPSIEEITTFAADWKSNSQHALKSKVDELLASSQYGERWGRHWMDVARYAESSGNGNFTYPHAWRYRDFVIDAFNKDTPYDVFITQQLAGDLMPAKTDQQWQENLIATGFLAIGIKDHGERNPRLFNMELIDEQIDTTSQAFLGLTVSCARCHDHKFDPIPTVDYYSMAGIFESTDTFYGTVFGQQNHQPRKLLELPLSDAKATTQTLSIREIQAIKDQIDSVKTEMQTIRRESRKPGGKQPAQNQMVSFRNQIARLEGRLKTVNDEGEPYTFGMGVQDGKPVSSFVLLGGDVEKKAQQVDRGFLQVLDEVPSDSIGSNSSGRKELAKWIGSEENPLTARVMVNRIWMHLLGTPLMESPNNWGLTSQPPTNPELLDRLAVGFMENGWSIKTVIREIVLSDTYQRAATFDADNFEIDPDNKTLWRANPRQLDAESLRDAMLAASKLLKTERPLASEVSGFGDAKIGRMIDRDSFSPLNLHRSVYLPIVRDALPESLWLFNFADPNATQASRNATNVPAQSLYLMNSDYVTYLSQQMAVELLREHSSTAEQVRAAFLTMFGRFATGEEIKLSQQFFKTFKPVPTKPVPISDQAKTNERSFPNRRRGQGDRQRGPMGRNGMNQNRNQNFGGRQRAMDEMANDAQPRRQRGGTKTAQIPKLKLNEEQQVLAAFCQSLMASAEFRILD